MDGGEPATFASMEMGTAEDWEIISDHFRSFAKGLPDPVLTHLRLLDGDFGGRAGETAGAVSPARPRSTGSNIRSRPRRARIATGVARTMS